MKAILSQPIQMIKDDLPRFLAILILFMFAVPPALSAMTKEQITLLKQFQKDEPELMRRVEIVEEGERYLAKISLDDILYLAITRSITLQASKIGEQAAAKQLALAEEITQPYLVTSLQHLKTGTLVSTDFNDTNGILYPYLLTADTNATVFTTAWQKKTSNGLLYSVALSNTTSQTDRYSADGAGEDLSLLSTGGTGDLTQKAELSASVSIPIFQDWGDINDIYKNRAQLGVDQAVLSTRSTGVVLLESVAKTYWTLVGLRSNIKTLEESVKLAQQLVNETKVRVDVGMLNQTDLKEATIQLATSQQNLFSARISEQEIGDQIRAALNLKSIPFGLVPADEPRVHSEDLDYETLLKKVYENDSTLEQLEVALQANQYDLDEALNKDKTNLDVTVGYSFLGIGSDLSGAIQNFSQSPLQGYQLGVTWTVPLFDDVTPEKIAKTKIERSKIVLQTEDIKSQLSIKLQTVIRNLRFGVEEEKNAVLSRNLAKDLMDKETEKMKIGKSTTFNVAQAQQKYTSAKYVETLVRVKSEQNYVALLSLTGELYNNQSVHLKAK